MKKALLTSLFLITLATLIISISSQDFLAGAVKDAKKMLAGIFFIDSITTNGLKTKFADAKVGRGKVKIIIVPGHDDDSWGTEFQGTREADLTAEVGEKLAALFRNDPEYEVFLTRDKAGYNKEFADYFSAEGQAVREFIKSKRQIMNDLTKAGLLHRSEDGVSHNTAAFDVASRLYAVNKWANEHGADLVIHIHFNDYPGRRLKSPGRYDGFTVYVPDGQYSNGKASRAIAEKVAAQLGKFYAESNLPKEQGGVVPDQELIALGAYNTLDAAGLLIEYGYIYEPRFANETVREKFLDDIALQTYIGLNRFFGNVKESVRRYDSAFLPNEWQSPLSQGAPSDSAIASLQVALIFDDLYPPDGKDAHDCPLSGKFGDCTKSAVKSFQEKYGIVPATGFVGELTLGKLNELYGK